MQELLTESVSGWTRLFSQTTPDLSEKQPSANLAYKALEYAQEEVGGGRPDTRIQIAWLYPENPLKFTAQELSNLDRKSHGWPEIIYFHGKRIGTQPRMIAVLAKIQEHERRIITQKSAQLLQERESAYSQASQVARDAVFHFSRVWENLILDDFSLNILRSLVAKIKHVPASSLPLSKQVLQVLNKSPENPIYIATSDTFPDDTLEKMDTVQLEALAVGNLIYMILHNDYSLEEAMSKVVDIYDRKMIQSALE